MRILIVGATGTIGSAVARALSSRHEVLLAGNARGDFRVDLADPQSIRALFQAAGIVDAVVSAAGKARFKPFADLEDEDFGFSLGHKLMGQANLVRFGLSHVADGGSFTLTSGILARHPSPGSAAISMVNSGLEGFVRAAALEAPRNIRVNVVSPPWVSETLKAMGRDPSAGKPADAVAEAYVRAVEGRDTGKTFDA
ncbi:MAG TPA: short chain dehydrogenase [Fibrobacteria bacterium]|jgi:NAD(P)-dependent dehydrogenase (short-subunit alcohol dehydrogenase family)|nr:short chain dehydrogenase [Fibrobacteria bacterium]